MTLKDTITQAITSAMKSKDFERIKVLRNLSAVIKQVEIDRRVTLSDSELLQIIQKQLKQRQESLTIFMDNGRDDLADKERFEMQVIEQFLPEPLDEHRLQQMIDEEIRQLSASGMQDMGKVMNAVKEKTVGRADPARISVLVKQALSNASS